MSVINNLDRQLWDNFVLASENSSCYHQSGWKSVVENSFGHRTYYIHSVDKVGEISGILPLVNIKSRLFGNYLVSLPYFNYGGACASNPESLESLLAEARLVAEETGSQHIELRHTENIFRELPCKTAKVSMRLSLPGDSEVLHKSFPSKLRSQIKKPVKEGLFALVGREEQLDNFYAVFSQNMRDLGTPVYGKAFFRNILEAFPKSTWICTIFSRNKVPMAAGFLVGYKDRLEIPWASSLRRFNSLSPNMLLYWSVLQFACERQYSVFDFGRSSPDEGTYRFKEQWGAKPVQLYWHYWLRSGGSLPELNPKNSKYKLAITIWKRAPVWVTRILGPAIVKNLP